MSVEAMKQALEALENVRGYDVENLYGLDDEITALQQAIAEAEKPWVKTYAGGKPNYTTPIEKQEPVAWMWKDGTLTSDPDFADGTWTPLFTAPVHASDISQERVDETAKDRREWVGLTHEEIGEIYRLGWSQEMELARAIEAKLKEKNNGNTN